MRMERQKRIRLRAATAALLLCSALLFSACGRGGAVQSRASFAMGSVLTVHVYSGKAPESLLNGICSAAAALDGRISATEADTEIFTLNRQGTGSCGADTLDLLKRSLSLCDALNGRLDITLGSVTSLWGFASDEPRLPSADEIASALETKGTDKVRINGSTVALGYGQTLDLGAVGKGAGCDAIRAVLDETPFPTVVSFGGTVLLYGQKPGGLWSVGVRDPKGAQEDYFATLSLQPETDRDALFISTSGSYEKTFTENGKTYHHILDPNTGYPVENGLASVTAVAKNGLTADALSTALFVNGLNETSLGWAEEYLSGAVFVFTDGRVYVTAGLRDAFTLANDGYTLTDTYA